MAQKPSAAQVHGEPAKDGGIEDFQCHVHNLRLRSDQLKCEMRADDLAKDLSGAELLLAKHQANKKKMAILEEAFRCATRSGQQLIKCCRASRPPVADTLRALLVDLSTERTALCGVWEERQRLYEQCRDLQTFYAEIEEANSWIDRHQAALAEEEEEGALDLDALVKKQEDLERAVAAQDEKIKALDQLATRLIDGLHQHGAQ